MTPLNSKNIFLFATCAALVLLLGACTVAGPLQKDSIDSVLSESIDTNNTLAAENTKNKKALSASTYKALIPEVHIPNTNTDNFTTNNTDEDQRFDIAVNNVPAKDFFMGLVKGTKYNITISPQVTGNISLELNEVSIPQAMEAVRNTYGFEYEKTSYGYQIFPRRLETRIFNVNYLNIDRSGQSQTAIGSGPITSTTQNVVTQYGVNTSQQAGAMPSGVIQTSINSNFWTLLKQNLLAIIGQDEKSIQQEGGRSIVINQVSGSIIVKAYPDELRHIAQYLDGIQNIMQRQVIIEAKILEIELNATYRAGINWKALGLRQGFSDNTTAGEDAGFPQLTSGIFNLSATGGDAFNTVIKLLNTQGSVNVLSSPRISTLNNQKAVIKVGGDNFFVTNVGSNVNNAGSSSTTSSNITLTPFFSGISLDVTPQIDEDDYISIHIHPIISKVTKDLTPFTVNNQTQEVPLAQSTVRESDSVVRAKSGQVIVIGGLMDSNDSSNQASTPGVDRIPIANGLFKNSSKISIKRELIILLRPIVINDDKVWQKELQARAKSFKSLKKAEGDFNYNIVPIKRK